MADERARKKYRLGTLSAVGGVTNAGLVMILKELEDNPYDGAVNYAMVQKASLAEYTDDMTLVIDLPLSEEPWVFKWYLCRPDRLIQRSTEVSGALRRLFAGSAISAEKVQSSPAQPWSIVLAHDEIVPGNVLRPDNARKFTCFYMSFKEFGHHAIRHELCWFHLGVLRTKQLEKVPGGLSCALRLLLKVLLTGPNNFKRGVVLPLDDGPTMLFAGFSNHLGDEAALAAGLSLKGAAGIKPCCKCANVVKKASDLATRRARLVEITCLDPSQFVCNEDEHISFGSHSGTTGPCQRS